MIESAAGVPVRRAVGVRSEIEMAVLDLYHVDDDADRTLHVATTLALELGPGSAELEGEYLGIPDEWQTSPEQRESVAEEPSAQQGATDADRTAPSTGGRLTEGERLAHLERQLINVSKVLAIIQARLDTIDARLANLASQVRASK